ncbi:hypothetical protein F4779DRAFT_592487 [Xylariaceae sp. FL0662B]|nr:hypothetical protein F4779DRAFT_592487 [Xylariaceae sp. FL0662B]
MNTVFCKQTFLELILLLTCWEALAVMDETSQWGVSRSGTSYYMLLVMSSCMRSDAGFPVIHSHAMVPNHVVIV